MTALVFLAGMMTGAALGAGIVAIFVGGSRDDGPPQDGSDFDTSIADWGYIGERRAGGEL